MTKGKRTKGPTTIYKTVHRKLKTEQPNQIKAGGNSGASYGLPVPVPHVTTVVLLLNDTNII